MKNKNHRRGFIRVMLIVIGALVLLKYIYDIDIVGLLTQGRFKELLDQFYSLGSKGWVKFNDVIIGAWNWFIEFAKNLIAKIK